MACSLQVGLNVTEHEAEDDHKVKRLRTEFTRITATQKPGADQLTAHPDAMSPNSHHAVAALGTPGAGPLLSTADISTPFTIGDSLINGGAGSMVIEFGDYLGSNQIELFENENGRLSHLASFLDAESLEEAEYRAFELFNRTVGILAFSADVPLEIKILMISNSQSTEHRIWTVLASPPVPMTKPLARIQGRFFPFLAAYRDGLNSINPSSQVLSFFRIIEGFDVIDKKQRRRSKSTPGGGRDRLESFQLPSSSESLPEMDLWSAKSFFPYFGKTFRQVFLELKESLRDDVAHLIPGVRELSSDSVYHADRCLDAVPVLRYMAHYLLNEEFDQQGETVN